MHDEAARCAEVAACNNRAAFAKLGARISAASAHVTARCLSLSYLLLASVSFVLIIMRMLAGYIQ